METTNVAKGGKIKLFTSIAIEIAAKCNRHCYFCPNDYFKRPDEYMPSDMFYHILKDLQSMNYHGRVEFYIYNEPTRDKRLAEFIAATRQTLPRTCLMINTNGDYFKTKEDIKYLFDCGLNQMQINVYNNADRYQEGTQFDKGIEEATKREAKFNSWISSLVLNTSSSLYQNIGPRKRVAKVIAKYGITTEVGNVGFQQFGNRSGLVPGFQDATEPLEKYCTKPFRFLNIDWRGNGILCCNDFNSETRFGNVKDMSVEQIWNSERFNQYRLKLQNGRRAGCFLCDKCNFNGGPYPHMINRVTFGKTRDKQLMGAVLARAK